MKSMHVYITQRERQTDTQRQRETAMKGIHVYNNGVKSIHVYITERKREGEREGGGGILIFPRIILRVQFLLFIIMASHSNTNQFYWSNLAAS